MSIEVGTRSRPQGPDLQCLVPAGADGMLVAARCLVEGLEGVAVIGERRARERRREDRRSATAMGRIDDRRSVRSPTGMRIADRRARTTALTGFSPPRWMVECGADVRFVRRHPPSRRERDSVVSLRLVARFQAGDDSAFDELYALWREPLTRYFAQRLADRYETEDAVQQVAEALLGSLGRYEIVPGVAFQGWLFRIAHNTAVTEFRRRKRVALIEADAMVRLHDEAYRDPHLAADVAPWELRRALMRLSPSHRRVLALRFQHGLTAVETARELGVSHAAARQLQARALRRLERHLDGPVAHAPAQRASMRRLNRGLPVLHARRAALLAA